jgi:hypothetical protein
LIATPVLAQSTMSPAPSAPSSDKMSPGSSTKMSDSAQSASAAGLWQGSKLVGLNVYNDQNQKIGSIVQLMVDKEGKIDTVVIGVGGFLGMGERDVAVKFSELKWSNEAVPSTTSGSNPPPATTGAGTTSTKNGPTTYPDHAVYAATKDQLKAMPQFDYNK